MTENLRQMIDDALDRAAASLEDIAAESGISYDTLYAWRHGRRNPSPENLARLADALEKRNDELARLVRELRRAADEMEGQE